MPINIPEKRGSGIGSLLSFAKKVTGIGDAVKSATELPGQIAELPGQIGALPGKIGDKIGGLFSSGEKPGVAMPEAKVESEAIPDTLPATGPMQRRMDNDPGHALHAGITALDDPSSPLDFDNRMAILEPILRAKVYGRGGGYA